MIRIIATTLLVAPQICFATLCLGGDGPEPWKDKSTSTHSQVIPTEGQVKEFFVWEDSGDIVYRNHRKGIYKTHADSIGKNKLLSYAWNPLSRLVDPLERFVATKKGHAVFDTDRSRWAKAKTPSHATPLFWKNGILYSAASYNGGSRHRIYMFDPAQKNTYFYCQAKTLWGKPLKLAKGHRYPNIYFYNTISSPTGDSVRFFKLDLTRDCRVRQESWKLLPDYFEGRVKEVYRFPSQRGKAVLLDHPTRNLFWLGDNYCKYYDVSQLKIMALNFETPTLGTWKAKEGLTLFNLPRGERTRIMKGVKTKSVTADKLWFTKDGTELLVAPLSDSRRHSVFRQLTLTIDGP